MASSPESPESEHHIQKLPVQSMASVPESTTSAKRRQHMLLQSRHDYDSSLQTKGYRLARGSGDDKFYSGHKY